MIHHHLSVYIYIYIWSYSVSVHHWKRQYYIFSTMNLVSIIFGPLITWTILYVLSFFIVFLFLLFNKIGLLINHSHFPYNLISIHTHIHDSSHLVISCNKVPEPAHTHEQWRIPCMQNSHSLTHSTKTKAKLSTHSHTWHAPLPTIKVPFQPWQTLPLFLLYMLLYNIYLSIYLSIYHQCTLII